MKTETLTEFTKRIEGEDLNTLYAGLGRHLETNKSVENLYEAIHHNLSINAHLTFEEKFDVVLSDCNTYEEVVEAKEIYAFMLEMRGNKDAK